MNHDLLAHLLDQHAAALELYARQWCATPEDIVQEAFLKLAGQSEVPANPAAWLFRVVRNRAIDAAHAARRRRHHETVAAAEWSEWFESDASDRRGVLDPESAAAELHALPIEEREVIIAHLWGGLTFEQFATVAGCSSSTAHRLYARGLSTLRERLGVPCRKNRSIPN
jgi:RNA polymerase sigma-70 factor (ECF subfamily)